MTKTTFSRWSSASGILVAESFFRGFIGQEVGPILPHFCNAWMARGETPSEKHSIWNNFEIIPTAPMGPKGAEGAPLPGGPKGPPGPRAREARVPPPERRRRRRPLGPWVPWARPGVLGIANARSEKIRSVRIRSNLTRVGGYREA